METFEIRLERLYQKSEYTIGKLYLNNIYFCDTLEDTVRNPDVKIHGKTAIPFGKYKIEMTFSNRFKKIMPLLIDVPNFKGIRIHSGNFSTDTNGCILTGKNTSKGQLTNSKLWTFFLYNRIQEEISKGKEVYITIIQ